MTFPHMMHEITFFLAHSHRSLMNNTPASSRLQEDNAGDTVVSFVGQSFTLLISKVRVNLKRPLQFCIFIPLLLSSCISLMSKIKGLDRLGLGSSLENCAYDL